MLLIKKTQAPTKKVAQTLKITLFVAFFSLYSHFMEKQKREKKRKNNSSPLTTKCFTKLRPLLEDQESMYLGKVKK